MTINDQPERELSDESLARIVGAFEEMGRAVTDAIARLSRSYNDAMTAWWNSIEPADKERLMELIEEARIEDELRKEQAEDGK